MFQFSFFFFLFYYLIFICFLLQWGCGYTFWGIIFNWYTWMYVYCWPIYTHSYQLTWFRTCVVIWLLFYNALYRFIGSYAKKFSMYKCVYVFVYFFFFCVSSIPAWHWNCIVHSQISFNIHVTDSTDYCHYPIGSTFILFFFIFHWLVESGR